MCTISAPLVADLCLYCYEIDYIHYLYHDNNAYAIEAFRYLRTLDEHLNIILRALLIIFNIY